MHPTRRKPSNSRNSFSMISSPLLVIVKLSLLEFSKCQPEAFCSQAVVSISFPCLACTYLWILYIKDHYKAHRFLHKWQSPLLWLPLTQGRILLQHTDSVAPARIAYVKNYLYCGRVSMASFFFLNWQFCQGSDLFSLLCEISHCRGVFNVHNMHTQFSVLVWEG